MSVTEEGSIANINKTIERLLGRLAWVEVEGWPNSRSVD
jgi:hypothetical protein